MFFRRFILAACQLNLWVRDSERTHPAPWIVGSRCPIGGGTPGAAR